MDDIKAILKVVIETASQEELSTHLGYDKHQTSDNSNSRNGYNDKTINSKYGQFDVSVPRGRESTFEPQLVKKREVLLDGSEDLILSDLYLGKIEKLLLKISSLSMQHIMKKMHNLPCFEELA